MPSGLGSKGPRLAFLVSLIGLIQNVLELIQVECIMSFSDLLEMKWVGHMLIGLRGTLR